MSALPGLRSVVGTARLLGSLLPTPKAEVGEASGFFLFALERPQVSGPRSLSLTRSKPLERPGPVRESLQGSWPGASGSGRERASRARLGCAVPRAGGGGPRGPFPRPVSRPAQAGSCPALKYPCGPAATPCAPFSATLFVLPTAPEPSGWGGGRGPPLRPRLEREVRGLPTLFARPALGAGRCREAQLGWVGFCSRHQITPGA